MLIKLMTNDQPLPRKTVVAKEDKTMEAVVSIAS